MASNKRRRKEELENFLSELEEKSGRASVIFSRRDYLSGEDLEDEDFSGNTYLRN